MLFVDNEHAPFGVHALCKEGLEFNRPAGEWQGPSAIIKTVHSVNKKLMPVKGFKIAIFNDGTIFLDKIERKMAKGNSVLISIPLRLGLTSITQEYLNCLKKVFTMPQNCGIVGGQDQRSLWFIGIINEHASKNPKLIYLDPHLVQDALLTPALTKEQ